MSRQQYLNSIKEACISAWQTHKILPSITAAQAVLEGNAGQSELAKVHHNHFGIKASSDWSGRTINMRTQEWDLVKGWFYIYADFRSYNSIEEGFADKAAFFTSTEWRKNNYRKVVGETNYKTAAQELKNAGYATDNQYPYKLIRIIEQYNLQEWDQIAFAGGNGNDTIPEDVPKPSTNLTIENVEYQDDIFVSPTGESIIYNKTLNDQFGFRPKGGQVLWIERILKVNTDNEQELLEEGLEYMREHSQPATQYTVSLKELPDTVSIGDVGIFVDHEFNPPLAIEARVLNITTSESNPNNNTVTIGNVKELYPQSKDDIIAIQKQLQDTREDLLDEFYEGEPLNIVIEGTSGLILSGERSQFRTELIIGPTTNLELTGQGSHTIELYGAKKTDNEFRFSGKLTNTLIFEEVDEAFKYIVENTESDAVIDDPSQNPQGIDIPNPLEPVDMKTLDIQEFEVEFLDALGQVVLTDTIPIYDDGQFNYPIIDFDKNIRQIRIIHDKDMDFATISFTEREANRATIDSTQLVARVYQGNREVTERFNNFSWVRVSNQSREDEGWNDKKKFVQANHVTVYADDIEDNESTFVVRLFDDDFERIVTSSSAVVKVNVEGKSAYQLAVEEGFEGTLDEWVASLRGSDGENGTPGEPGEDGQSTYIHVAWADSPMGDGFSTSDSTDKEYMGTYIDETEEDSENYLDYEWMKVKGDKGKDGDDGTTTYTWTKYADTPTSGMNNNPEGKKYIGLAFNQTTQDESNNYSDYQWSLMPQNIDIGVRNLILDSGTPIESSAYMVAEYFISEDFVEGQEYTVTIKGTKNSTVSFGLWQNRDSHGRGIFKHIKDDLYQLTFTSVATTAGNERKIRIYQSPSGSADKATIEWIKMVKGDYSSLDWSPAPEDTQSQIDDKASAGDLDETIRTIETESEKIASLRTDVDITKNNMLITHTDEYVNKITTTESTVDGLESRVVSVEETKENVDTFFQFDEAFTIGKSNAQTKLRMTNDEIQFLDGETKGTYITGNTMVSQNITIQDKLNLTKHTVETEGDVTVIRFTG